MDYHYLQGPEKVVSQRTLLRLCEKRVSFITSRVSWIQETHVC